MKGNGSKISALASAASKRFQLEKSTNRRVSSSENLNQIFSWTDIAIVLFVITFFISGAVQLYFTALNFVSVGDVCSVDSCIHFICNVLVESYALRKRPHILTILAGFCGLTGTVLICQPRNILKLEFDVNYSTGVGFASLAGIAGTIYYCSLQKFKNVSPQIIYLSYFLGLFVLNAYHFLIRNGLQISVCEIYLRFYAIIATILFCLAGVLFIYGSQATLPSIAGSLKLLIIVLGYIFQVLFLDQPLSLLSALGGLFTMVGILIQSVGLTRWNA